MEIISTAHLMRRSSSLPRSKMRRRTLAVRLPRELQRTIISPRGTVEKYAIYARAMDALAEKDAEIVPRILSGQYKIAHKNVVELSKLSPPEIKKVERRIKKMQQPFISITKAEMPSVKCRKAPEELWQLHRSKTCLRLTRTLISTVLL
ncbi:MAG: hypothetical protein ACLVHV_03145 [Oscillospiraceae bacterium]